MSYDRLSSLLSMGEKQGADAERARIVAWLRARADALWNEHQAAIKRGLFDEAAVLKLRWSEIFRTTDALCIAIERGEHREGA